MLTDSEKIRKIKSEMRASGIDVLVCRNPENVLYLSGYWPVTGWSLVIFPAEGDPALIVPEAEVDFARESWIRDVRTYPTETLREVWNPYKHLRELLSKIEIPKGARVGCEMGFETMATNNVVGELNYANLPTFDLIREVWKVELVDASRLLLRLRMIKSETEIVKIKLANEIAAYGLKAALEVLKEGVKESQVAATAEKAVQEVGIGYKNAVRRARGFAFVMSGPNATKAWYPFNISTDRRLKSGDLVLIEFNVYADGYWTDITRTWVLGSVPSEIKDMHQALLDAQEAAWETIKEGVPAPEVDKAARQLIAERGYSKYFPHRLGHGIGVRLHEPPAIHPASADVLSEGMVITIEPGLYTKTFGMRVEDVVLVLKGGAERLSLFDRSLEA